MLLLDAPDQARAVSAWPPAAVALAEAFWPGGVTVVVDQLPGANLPPELTGGLPTIGLRMPDHACPRALAAAVGPLPVTSANLSGLPPARDAAALHGGEVAAASPAARAVPHLPRPRQANPHQVGDPACSDGRMDM